MLIDSPSAKADLSQRPAFRRSAASSLRGAVLLAVVGLASVIPWRLTAAHANSPAAGLPESRATARNLGELPGLPGSLAAQNDGPSPVTTPAELPPVEPNAPPEVDGKAPQAAAGNEDVNARWEDVLLLEAVRYLRLSPSQIQLAMPLVRVSAARLKKLDEQNRKTLESLAKIAEQNRRALLEGRPGFRQDDAVALDRIMRKQKALAADEIVTFVAPRLVRILSREQAARAYLLTIGQPVHDPDRVASAALLDPTSGFVVGSANVERDQAVAAVNDLRSHIDQQTEAVTRQLLAQNYPAAVVDSLLGGSTGNFSSLGLNLKYTDVLISKFAPGEFNVQFTKSNDAANGVATAPAVDPNQLQAAQGALQKLQADPNQLLLRTLEAAPEKDVAEAIRLFVRRMFMSPRLKPVLEERLHRGG